MLKGNVLLDEGIIAEGPGPLCKHRFLILVEEEVRGLMLVAVVELEQLVVGMFSV